ncbi:ABC-type uncharacterized transport system fused permease/ATPase subunit [Kitasatospora sp. GAS204A]|nr:ABC-type uncharacterized transport system fused permease/ATPase subunit [Kitasatospora sp. GAS204B]
MWSFERSNRSLKYVGRARRASCRGCGILLGVFRSSTFVKNLWQDSAHQAFTNGDHGHPTAFFWIHLALAVTSFVLGVVVGAVGLRGLRAGKPLT